MIDRYAVIGNPVAHSVSPQIHAIFAKATGQALRYDKIRADAFAPVAADFFRADGRGLNVTVPFKQDAYRWVDRVDDAAREAESVNVVVPGESLQPGSARGDPSHERSPQPGSARGDPSQNRHYSGHNTDGIGLVRDLEQNLRLPLSGQRVLVLGAGGAVRGVLGPLLRAGVAGLTVANRTESKARALQRVFPDVNAVSLAEAGKGYDVVINGTSAGMGGQVPEIDPRAVRNAFCYDMFYVPSGDTPFCAWSRQHGAAGVAGGLGMLIEQAAESFFLWRGVRPVTAGVEASLGLSCG